METSPGHVENALLHVIEAEQSSHTELRVAAMHDRSPIHTFLFDSQGSLLTANKAALQFCQTGSGQPAAACNLFFAVSADLLTTSAESLSAELLELACLHGLLLTR